MLTRPEMSTVALDHSPTHDGRLRKVLPAAAASWLAVAVAGQWAFAYYLIAFYGSSTLAGRYQLWTSNTLLRMSYVRGDTLGNVAFASHALLAAVIAFGGALQLVPQIRKRAIAVHRWTGRVFFVTALGLSASGLYMEWIRGDREDLISGVAISINAVLIILFCLLAWRAALRRELQLHRRWALRAYLVANAQWFTRVGFLAWMVLSRLAPHGAAERFDDAFAAFWMFGCYSLPLAVLELYLRARQGRSLQNQLAVAGAIFALTLIMAVGILGASAFLWWPLVHAKA